MNAVPDIDEIETADEVVIDWADETSDPMVGDIEPAELGVNAEDVFPVPDDNLFGSLDYAADEQLSLVAGNLITSLPTFAHLQGVAITVLWKRKGGEKHGRPVLGTAKKTTPYEKYITGDQLVIMISADHLRDRSKREVEMAVHEALCACGKDKDGNPIINPPDFTGYVEHVRRYGAATAEMRAVKQALQLELGI